MNAAADSAPGYIRRETAISVAINSALSALFVVLIFGIGSPVPVWGSGGLVVDCLLQGFMIALMSTVVPGLITARRLRSGALQPIARSNRLPAAIVPRALLLGVMTAVLAAGLFGAIAWLVLPAMLPSGVALVAKTALGALLALIVTPPSLRAAMASPFMAAPSRRLG